MDQPGSPAMVSDDGKDRLGSPRLPRDDTNPARLPQSASPVMVTDEGKDRLDHQRLPSVDTNPAKPTSPRSTSPCLQQSSQMKLSNPSVPKTASTIPAKSSKPRCPCVISADGKECRKLANRIVGKCDDCGKIFCSAHRYMEEHNCEMQALVSILPPTHSRHVKWWMVGLDDLLPDCCGADVKALVNLFTLADKTEALCG